MKALAPARIPPSSSGSKIEEGRSRAFFLLCVQKVRPQVDFSPRFRYLVS